MLKKTIQQCCICPQQYKLPKTFHTRSSSTRAAPIAFDSIWRWGQALQYIQKQTPSQTSKPRKKEGSSTTRVKRLGGGSIVQQKECILYTSKKPSSLSQRCRILHRTSTQHQSCGSTLLPPSVHPSCIISSTKPGEVACRKRKNPSPFLSPPPGRKCPTHYQSENDNLNGRND